MRFRKPDFSSARAWSPKTIAKIAAWPAAAFAATYAFSFATNLPRKMETSLFVAFVFLIVGIRHTRKERKESRPKEEKNEPKKSPKEGESFFTKPWPPAKK